MDFEIYLREEGTKLPVPFERLRHYTRRAFRATGQKAGDVSLVVCDDRFIVDLNRKYLGEKGPTDVLAFPLREGEGRNFEYGALGDIVISVETAGRQSNRLGRTLEEEFTCLYVHGLLHLFGFTHDDREERERMQGVSDRILEEGAGEA